MSETRSDDVIERFVYTINIEGVDHQWKGPSITTEEIARLGGWNPADGVVAVDQDNNERTLSPGEVIPLALGTSISFGRRIRFKRGRADRMAAELQLLREEFPGVIVDGDWYLLPEQRIADGWTPNPIPIVFRVADAYPGTPPYGIYVPTGLSFQGNAPTNFTAQCGQPVPFPGSWGVLSWSVEHWFPTASVRSGANLVRFARSFAIRFAEGA